MKRSLVLTLALVICCAAAVTAIAVSDNENFEADPPKTGTVIVGVTIFDIVQVEGSIYDGTIVGLTNPIVNFATGATTAATFEGESITINIVAIGPNALSDSKSILKTVIIGNNIRTIGISAFEGCTELSSISFSSGTIPSLTVIGDGAFYNCTNLRIISAPNGIPNLTSIGMGVFRNCISLQAFPFDACTNLNEIDGYAFDGCSSLESVTLPASMITLNEAVFRGCDNLAEVTFEDGIKISIISEELFQNCYSLQEIEIPESVTSIGEYAFNGCDLYIVNLPSGVTSIGVGAFINSGARIISMPESNLGNQVAFEIMRTEILVGYDISTIKSVTIESLVGTLLSISFVPNSPLEIKNLSVVAGTTPLTVTENDGAWSFAVTPGGGVYRLTAEFESYSLTYRQDGTLFYVTGGANLAGDIVIPETRRIGKDRTGVVIGIDAEAFKNETLITSVTIPERMSNIGDEAFKGCTGLTTIIFDGTSRLATIGYGAFENSGLTAFSVPDRTSSIGEGAFNDCVNLTTFNYGNSQVTAVGMCMFQNTAITSIAIPSTVETVYEYAFNGCEDLASVMFGKDSVLKTIYDSAFNGCGALTSINLPESLTEICDFAFSNTGLTSVHIPGSVVLGEGAFMNCANLESAVLGYGISDIPADLFDNCVKLKSVGMPSTIATVDNNAFSGCYALKVIAIPEGAVINDDGVFEDEQLVVWFSGPATGMMASLSKTGNIIVHIQMSAGETAGTVTATNEKDEDISVTGTGNTRTLEIDALNGIIYVDVTTATNSDDGDDNGGSSGGDDDGTGGDDNGNTPGGDDDGDGDGGNGGGDNTMLFIGIGAAVAIVALAGVYFLFIRKP